MTSRGKKHHEPVNRLTILKIVVILIGSIITIRLFYLQVIRYDYYQGVAAKEHYGETQLPARRGEIFIKDYASSETVRVATNITLDTLFADPTIIKNKKIVADRLVPLIYDLKEERQKDNDRIDTLHKRAQTQEDLDKIKPLTDEELYKQFYDEVLNDISQEIRPEILLADNLADTTVETINKLGLTGIEAVGKRVKAFPPQITNKEYTASILSKYLEILPDNLAKILEGKNRYVILKKKIKPETSVAIQKIIDQDKDKNFFGIGMKEEYYRYYPEGTLAANVLGFVTANGLGNYGIESKYNTQLQGKTGVFQAQRDGSVYGRQITVGDSVIKPAVDGDNIVLTIDRAMELQIEKKLAKAVQDYRADSGQVIVMNPKTGNIMAMAHYPSFDPNNYSTVTDKEDINFTENEVKQLVPIESDTEKNTFWFYRNLIAHDRYKVFLETLENGQKIYKRYTNWIGLEALQNKAVSEPYEPGSIMKPLVMSGALDDKDVTPSTAFNDPGFLKIDLNSITGKYDSEPITNVSSGCTGYINMTTVIANSCNTGISWVAKKMGKSLFYSYLVKFGLGERTGIEFDGENTGNLQHFTAWQSESEFLTKAYGQGITATPLQMITAFAAIANKGLLMQPHIVSQIQQGNGKVVQTDPFSVQQVISEQTANTVTAMMVAAVENGVAKTAGLPNHYVAGKTGTAQTYKNGKALNGAGTTFVTMVGFGPIDDPKFVILVKLDRPRSTEWSEGTATILFRDVAAYMYDYFGLPPDKK